MNLDNLDKLIVEKYISKTKHPTLDLWILNYTHKAQYDQHWCEETLQCRGLIMDENFNVVARPFRKFFNLSQVADLPAEDFTVTEKMDGSLGILYWTPDGPAIATRGSFTSDQAIRATKLLRTKYKDVRFSPFLTYLFEIILPENRIVVDYGKTEDLVLLAIIETSTGTEMYYGLMKHFSEQAGLRVVKSYDGITDFNTLKDKPRDNAEGYVVRFESGLRVKIKFDEYVRLHRLLTNVNAKAIWDLLRNGQPLDELLERVPDEFYNWVRKTSEKLTSEFSRINDEVFELFLQLTDIRLQEMSRKELAVVFQGFPKFRGILFAMLDGKDYSQIIWKMIRPEAEKPFRMEFDN